MAVTFVFSALIQCVYATSAEDYQKLIEENQERIEQLKDQQAEQSEIVDALKEQDDAYQSQLDSLNAEVDEFTAKINAKSDEDIIIISEKIAKFNLEKMQQTFTDEQKQELKTLGEEIDELQSQITALENEIEEINDEIEKQNKQIDLTYEMLGERLRAMYMAGQTTDLEVLLSSDDFSDFLTRTELLRRVSEHDTALVKELEEKIKELNAMADELEKKKHEQQEQKKKLDDEKYQLVIDRGELQDKVDEVQKTADEIEAQRKANAKKLQNLVDLESYYEKQNEEYANAIDEIARKASSGSGDTDGDNFTNDDGFTVSSSGFICPLQYSGTYVSAGYGTYPSGRSGHTGVDYCVSGGTSGKNVRAIAGGTVILVKYLTTSYGYHVMIDHGNGITSLYAHASKILVSEGDTVSQGDIIMLAGETGNATGAHVHLEIRINGTRVNPSNYVDLP